MQTKTRREICLAKAKGLAAKGLTMAQIAAALGVSERKLYKDQAQIRELKLAIEQGRAETIEAVANVVLTEALGGNLKAAMFYLRSRAGWNDRQQLAADDREREIVASAKPELRIVRIPDLNAEFVEKKVVSETDHAVTTYTYLKDADEDGWRRYHANEGLMRKQEEEIQRTFDERIKAEDEAETAGLLWESDGTEPEPEPVADDDSRLQMSIVITGEGYMTEQTIERLDRERAAQAQDESLQAALAEDAASADDDEGDPSGADRDRAEADAPDHDERPAESEADRQRREGMERFNAAVAAMRSARASGKVEAYKAAKADVMRLANQLGIGLMIHV